MNARKMTSVTYQVLPKNAKAQLTTPAPKWLHGSSRQFQGDVYLSKQGTGLQILPVKPRGHSTRTECMARQQKSWPKGPWAPVQNSGNDRGSEMTGTGGKVLQGPIWSLRPLGG